MKTGERTTMIKLIKKQLLNTDGSINAQVLMAAITALLMVIQSALAVFKIEFRGDWGQIQLLISAILTFLAVIGVVKNTDDKQKGSDE